MENTAPDHDTQIAILTGMVLDLYARYAALANTTLGVVSNPDSLRETEKEARDALFHLPEIVNLIERVDTAAFEAARPVLRDFYL
jgi:hypothetical protein